MSEIDSTAVLIFVDVLTNTVFIFVNATNISTNIETAVLSSILVLISE